ncbi:MAG: hypothetical protein O2856_10985 [Planctomycetota bacterium]|nr:hypothetical protein [Planctomycetota bacterium]
MAVAHTNRRGETYHLLQGKTKTGKLLGDWQISPEVTITAIAELLVDRYASVSVAFSRHTTCTLATMATRGSAHSMSIKQSKGCSLGVSRVSRLDGFLTCLLNTRRRTSPAGGVSHRKRMTQEHKARRADTI